MVEEGANSKTFTARNALMKMFKLKAYDNKIFKENEKQKNADEKIVKKAEEEIKNLEKQKAQFKKRSYVREEFANNEYIAYKNASDAYKALVAEKLIEEPLDSDTELALTKFFVNMQDNTWKKDNIAGILTGNQKIMAELIKNLGSKLSPKDLYTSTPSIS